MNNIIINSIHTQIIGDIYVASLDQHALTKITLGDTAHQIMLYWAGKTYPELPITYKNNFALDFFGQYNYPCCPLPFHPPSFS